MCQQTGCNQPVRALNLCSKHYQRQRQHSRSDRQPSGGVDELTMRRFQQIAGTGPLVVRCVRILQACAESWWGTPYVLDVDELVAKERSKDKEAVRAALADNETYRRERRYVRLLRGPYDSCDGGDGPDVRGHLCGCGGTLCWPCDSRVHGSSAVMCAEVVTVVVAALIVVALVVTFGWGHLGE